MRVSPVPQQDHSLAARTGLKEQVRRLSIIEGPAVMEHLKNAGKWVLDFASKVGASLVAEVTKKALGM